MFWTSGVVLVALAFVQVPGELAKPVFIEDVISKAGSAGSRIVSGWEALPGQLPHQVSLRQVSPVGGVSACGGSIVARNWVITAAHCTAGAVTVVVRAGLTSLSRPQYIFESTEWWNHPTFDENRPLVVQPNDIAILKLQRAVVYTDILKAIRIQPSSEAFRNYGNERVIASGWGRTWTNGAQPEVLNWVYLRAISNPECQLTFGSALINNNAICAGFYNVTSQSTCQGDSGGPLVHESEDGVPVLVGIASFVAGGDWGCHSGLPAGFIRPGPFLLWLNEISGLDFENLDEDEDGDLTPTTTTEDPGSTTLSPESEEPGSSETKEDSNATESEEDSNATESEEDSNATESEEDSNATESEEDSNSSKSEEDSNSSKSEEDTNSSDEDKSEEDPEISELLKKLVVKVKVKVNINNNFKKKVKVKSVHQ